MNSRLRNALIAASEQMPTVQLAPDTWQRGQRGRRWARLRAWLAGVAAVAVAGAVGTAVVRPGLIAGAEPTGEAVPSQVALPWMLQATVQTDPIERAVVTFSGESLGLTEPNVGDWDDDLRWFHHLAVVGPDGGTRVVEYLGAVAGGTVLVSPDGTRVAGGPPRRSSVGVAGIVDLTTGQTTRLGPDLMELGGVLAWAPDGRSLLAREYSVLGGAHVTFGWLDLDSRVWTPFEGADIAGFPYHTWLGGAVAPDGQRAAVAIDQSLRLFDRAGRLLWDVDLGERGFLGGVGAFSPDGSRIAILALTGCLDDCDTAELAARQWSVSYVDAATGRPADGPTLPAVTGAAVTILGWSLGRDAVVVRNEPTEPAPDEVAVGWFREPAEAGHATLLRLSPDGTTMTLLDPPAGVTAIDVPLDLITAGRFGGPPSHASLTPIRSLGGWWNLAAPYVYAAVCLLVVVALVVLAVRWRRRRRRTELDRDTGSR